MVDYNVNVNPILAQYNNSNTLHLPLIDSDNTENSLANIRGSGNYNPSPQFLNTMKKNKQNNIFESPKDISYSQVFDNIEQQPVGAIQTENSWNNNINKELDLHVYKNGNVESNYKYFDEYQRWAYNAVRKSDPYLLPFYFSKINITFIQNKVVDIVNENRGIKINTSQDIEGLLNIMLSNYTHAWHSNGIIGSNKCATNPNEDPNAYFSNILAKLNQYTIQQYVKMVFSTLNITEYYIKDISTLPIPLSQPVPTSNKGINQLGFVGFFEDNHNFTKNINSFNTRNVLPS